VPFTRQAVLCIVAVRKTRTLLVDMPVIVRHQIEAHCASITGMTGHYAAGGQRSEPLIAGIMPRGGCSRLLQTQGSCDLVGSRLHPVLAASEANAVRQGGQPAQRDPAALRLRPFRDSLQGHACLQDRLLAQVLDELNETFDAH
jgi:hypothetical protein